MIRVLLLCRYGRNGSSSRLRFFQYLPHLEAYGIRVAPAPFFDEAYLSRLYAGRRARPDHLARYYAGRLRDLLATNRYDLIWLEKEALPWLPSWLERAWLRRRPFVLDLDDAWFHLYGSHRSGLVRHALGGKLEALARRAAAVVAGNGYLADWARSSGARDVVELPTAVDLERYRHVSPPPRRQPFTIGWIGSPSTAAYLEGIAGALDEVCARSGTRLRLVGAREGIDLAELAPEWRPWSEKSEAGDIASFDVGIAPLDDGPWERGKCAYKIVQYMAAARPVVASRVGANASVVKDGETGFQVETEREWVDALARLRADPVLRQRMGKAGRARVEEHYALTANVGRLADTLRAACGASPARSASDTREERAEGLSTPP